MKRGKNSKLIAVRVLLTLLLVSFCLGVWPGYLFHTYKKENRYTTNVFQSVSLKPGESAKQWFVPADKWISRISLAVAYDEQYGTEDRFTFAIKDEQGKTILEEELYFGEIENGSFCSISVDQKVKPNKLYCWQLFVPEDIQSECAILCTEDTNGNAVENRELYIADVQSVGNALNQYEYYAHRDKVVIIGGYWAGALMVYLFLLELVHRLEEAVWRKKNEEKVGIPE